MSGRNSVKTVREVNDVRRTIKELETDGHVTQAYFQFTDDVNRHTFISFYRSTLQARRDKTVLPRRVGRCELGTRLEFTDERGVRHCCAAADLSSGVRCLHKQV